MGKERLSVAALTTGRHDPSARFRIRQHIDPLYELGIEVKEHIPFVDKYAGVPHGIKHYVKHFPKLAVDLGLQGVKLSSRISGLINSIHSDFVWLNRELLPGQYTLERLVKRPFVLDVDDAIWCHGANGFEAIRRLGSEAVAVTAGNQYLADWFSQWNSNIHIVPTAIDTDRFTPGICDNIPYRKQNYTVGWTGTFWNLSCLYGIEKPLNLFLEKSNSKLMVVADKQPEFQLIKHERVDFRRWSPEVEASSLQEMDVGLMPLPDSEWTRGKCSFKMLQYMSAAIPVVVSPVGMNIEVLGHGLAGYPAVSDDDWFDALNTIFQDRQLAIEMGKTGRGIIIEKYSRRLVSEIIANVFHSLA
ncbi:MAG: glycosyltransferase family 4 protein [bacterium]